MWRLALVVALFASCVCVASAASTVTGGAGVVSARGFVGPLRLDRSTVADVERFAGAPDVRTTGTFEAPIPSPHYFALGYGCSKSRRTGIDPGAYEPKHIYCQTAYFFPKARTTLSAFWTDSPHFRTRAGTRPGMTEAEADRREHRFARVGCWSAMILSTAAADLMLQNVGGKTKGSGQRLVGGRIDSFSLESHRHPVGLLFC